MCGIVGGLWLTGTPDNAAFAAALDAMEHRGPDGRGAERLHLGDADVLLGQTRLAIIDLTEGGRQPMAFADDRYWIVFNGEIYNYVELRSELAGRGVAFRSASDTEVLLAAWAEWGIAAIPRLRGMFAFAILDTHTRELVCVRDAFGIKPLYFTLTETALAFASEPGVIGTLTGSRPVIDERRIYEYLVTGAPDGSATTALAGVRSLPPGHLARFRIGADGTVSMHESRWWNPDVREQLTSRREAVVTVRQMVLENIRLHLRTDVPLAVALSGGLDSSTIACAIRAVEPESDIHTFSYLSADAALNEGRWTSAVNERIGAIPHEVSISDGDLADDIDDVIRALGEPFGSTSIYAQYRVFKEVRRQGFTVTLDGQGADEIFGGYVGYPDFRVLSMLRRGDLVGAARFLRAWGTEPGRSRKQALRGAAASSVGSGPRRVLAPLVERRGRPGWINAAYAEEHGLRARAGARPEPWVYGRDMASRLLQAMTGGELATLLRHGDRNAMRWSVESRTPFLTTDLAEYALSLPESFLVDPTGMTKSVLREAMEGIVPTDVLMRRDKIGFGTPEAAWLRHLTPKLQTWLDDLPLLPMVDPSAARALVESAFAGQAPLSGPVWRILCATRWARLL